MKIQVVEKTTFSIHSGRQRGELKRLKAFS